MIYLSQTLYLWWLAAFALGMASVFFAPRGDDARGWLAGGVFLFALAATAALARIVHGRAGLWLDTGVLAVAAYGVGGLVGSALAAPFLIGARASAPAAKKRLQELLSPAEFPGGPPIRETAAVAAGVVPQAEAPEPAQVSKGDELASSAPPPPMARPNQQDDLRLIRGIDAALAEHLNEIGVWRFAEIAAWGPERIAWASQRLGGTASPKHWPAQARLLASGVLTDYARATLNGEQPGPADDEDLAAWLETLPRPAAPGASDGFYAGARPAGFAEPPLGETDDLTRLSGVDAETAARLNGLGVWTIRQIACWSQDNARWIGAFLATPGAPEREDWIGQARALTHAPAPSARPV